MPHQVLVVVAIGCACLLLSACAAPGRGLANEAALAEARAALLATDAAWGEAGFSNEARWPRSFWTDDAAMGSVAREGQSFGADSLVELLDGVWERDPAFRLVWRPTHAWVSADGLTGCTMGVGTRTRTDPSTGGVVSDPVRYTGVWRFEGGEWKCVLDIDTTDGRGE